VGDFLIFAPTRQLGCPPAAASWPVRATVIPETPGETDTVGNMLDLRTHVNSRSGWRRYEVALEPAERFFLPTSARRLRTAAANCGVWARDHHRLKDRSGALTRQRSTG